MCKDLSPDNNKIGPKSLNLVWKFLSCCIKHTWNVKMCFRMQFFVWPPFKPRPRVSSLTFFPRILRPHSSRSSSDLLPIIRPLFSQRSERRYRMRNWRNKLCPLSSKLPSSSSKKITEQLRALSLQSVLTIGLQFRSFPRSQKKICSSSFTF